MDEITAAEVADESLYRRQRITSTVVKSVGGAFTISGDYSCPPLFNGISPLVYLIAYASIASSSTNLAGIT